MEDHHYHTENNQRTESMTGRGKNNTKKTKPD